MNGYTLEYFDGRYDPLTDKEEWFPLRERDHTLILYSRPFLAATAARALVATGHVYRVRIWFHREDEEPMHWDTVIGTLSVADKAHR